MMESFSINKKKLDNNPAINHFVKDILRDKIKRNNNSRKNGGVLVLVSLFLLIFFVSSISLSIFAKSFMSA